MEFRMKPIGVIHTPLTEIDTIPIQSSRSEIPGSVDVFSQYADGLEGIEGFSHVFLVYAFHLSRQQFSLTVHPFLDDQKHGIFATRHPERPNPLGFSVVQLVRRENNMLFFRGADMLDGTPLLDIKPYIPDFDVFAVEKTGWYQHRKHA
jgi:tRNA-Thr(GGU) m(6)t(6)A37 methyltransferase TsaA